MNERKSVAIVGAGPCGVAAAIQVKRSKLEPLLFERDTVGGLLLNAQRVENYPGFYKGISGTCLSGALEEHLKAFEIVPRQVEIVKVEPRKGAFQLVTVDGLTLNAVSVILATGTRPIQGIVPGEERLAGRSLFYEIRQLPCQGLGKRAVIVGGSDAAYDYALTLAGRGCQVKILQRSAARCLPLLLDRVANHPGIAVLEGVEISECRETVAGLTLRLKPGDRAALEADFLLIACGRSPEDRLLSGTVPAGLFTGGDLVRGDFRQAAIAAGDGIRAAMQAVRYVITKK